MGYLEEFLVVLYKYLTEEDGSDSNIIRKHRRSLESSGDLSFPLAISNWRVQIQPNFLKEDIKTIFKYALRDKSECFSDILVNASKTWPLHISKCTAPNSEVQIYLDRTGTFRRAIELVYLEKEHYGRCNLGLPNNIFVTHACEHDDHNNMDLSELRMILSKDVAVNLLHRCNVNVVNSESQVHQAKVTFTLRAVCDSGAVILCSAVLNEKGLKDKEHTAEQLLRKRAIDMRLAAEHKYGLRMTSQPGWKECFDKLGEAAVIIELLENKPSHNVRVYMNNPIANNKGASFILYNCARLTALFKEFDRKVTSGIYPKLPSMEDTDFSLLKRSEEWELLYVYILQFPFTIKMCVRGILNGRFNSHILISMLSNLVQTFSIYYQRVKILMEPRQHLFALLHARIHLLKALEQVLHNGLRLLNIQPVRQM